MSLQAYDLTLDGDFEGVAIVESCSGLPLRLPPSVFQSVDEAHEFIEYLEAEHSRGIAIEVLEDYDQLEPLLVRWRAR